jgi:nitrogen fixation/metabolism regulation signal transduction histidine kinase
LLIGQARRVAAGDLGARSLPRQLDELGELTVELNRMLDRLVEAAADVCARRPLSASPRWSSCATPSG